MTAALPQEARLAPGALVGGRFEIGDVLGEDLTGVVYRAKDRAGGRPATVKALHRRLMQSREYASRFRRETSLAARIRDGAAARVIACGATEDHLAFVASEEAGGPTLAEILAKEGPMPASRAAAIARRLLSALEAAHREGVVHRDLTPASIRVERGEDGVERPKILDLGVPRTLTGDVGDVPGGVRTRAGVVLGAPRYMAPELLRGEASDGRADVYSLGAVLYEMLGGKPPFDADDLPTYLATKLNEPAAPLTQRFPKAAVPAALDRLVLSMLEKDSDARPGDDAALGKALAPFAAVGAGASDAARGELRGMAAVVVGGLVGGVAAAALAGARGAQTASLAPAAAAAAIGLGVGAAIASRLGPRTSVDDFLRRFAAVAATLAVFATASIPLSSAPAFHAACVAATCAATALLSYAGHLLVSGTRAAGLRPLVAGVAAPALALALAPVLVAPAKHEPYFAGTLAAARTDSERDARTQFVVAAACISLSFGLASTLLPRAKAKAE